MQALAATSDLNATAQSKGTNVQVVVRCRPLNSEEKKSGQPSVITCDTENKMIKVSYGPVGKKIMKNFTFDKVFGVYSRQDEVFESVVRPIVDETLAGFNCTIFAYGQTGTGKTHTMEGDIHSKDDAGIVPRTVNAILEQLEGSGSEFTIRVSFLELYNEELQDLLNNSGEKKLKLCEDVKKGVVCQNLEEIAVLTASDTFEILQRGIQQRQTAATLCNKNSSRSHSIFTMKIMIKEYNVEGEEVVRHGQLNLVDLAGSECIGRSGAKNDRAREAGSINQSLLTLGRVITALVDHHQHVPYRDSKLTRLLQESLGGKAKTCIIATLSPSQQAVEETLSTLDYAHRAKNIKNQPTVNQKLTKKVIMKEYFAEIETLRNQLVATREKNGVYLDPADFYNMESKIATQEAQLMECEMALKARNEEVKAIRSDYEVLEAKVEGLEGDLVMKTEECQQTKDLLVTAQGNTRQTYQEWRASEAVVAEQRVTETGLLQQGQALFAHLGRRGEEVHLLLTKCVALSGQETSRMALADGFVQSLNTSHGDLLEVVQTLTQRNAQDSQVLNRNIGQMLVHARSTCSSLDTALQQALQVLIGDTAVTKDSMVSTCLEVSQAVSSEHGQLVMVLTKAKTDLSQFFQEMTATLEKQQSVFQQQQSAMKQWSQEMTATHDKMSAQTTSFVTQQSSLSHDFVKELQGYQEGLQTMFQVYQQRVQAEQQKEQAAFQQKAQAMQQMFSSMLQEMIVSQQTAQTSLSAMLATQVDTFTTYTNQQTAQLTKKSGEQLMSQVNAHHAGITELLQQQEGVVVEASRSTDNAYQQLANQAKEMTVAISNKRKHGEEAHGQRVNEIEGLTKRVCLSVDGVRNSADEVLSKVSTASQAMHSTAKTAMDSFLAFVDREGEGLKETLQQHLAGNEHSYQEQAEQLQQVRLVTEDYATDLQTAVLPAMGNTPTKALKAQEVDFMASRPIGQVKEEVRQAAIVRELSYEEAVASLVDYQQKAGNGEEVVEKAKAVEVPGVVFIEMEVTVPARPAVPAKTTSSSVVVVPVPTASVKKVKSAVASKRTPSPTSSVSSCAKVTDEEDDSCSSKSAVNSPEEMMDAENLPPNTYSSAASNTPAGVTMTRRSRSNSKIATATRSRSTSATSASGPPSASDM